MSDLTCDRCGGSGKQYELYEEPGDDITCSKCGGHGFDPELVDEIRTYLADPDLGRAVSILSVVRERLER